MNTIIFRIQLLSKMNLAVSRIGLQLTSVSNLRHFSHCFKSHLFNVQTNSRNAVIIFRPQSSKPNLFLDKRKHWYEPEKQTIGAYGWFLLSLPLFAFGLGCWQVERLKWKLALIAELEDQLNKPPVDLPSDYQELRTMEYQPVKVKGKFLHDREFIIGPRSLIINGAPASGDGGGLISGNVRSGYMVITPFQLEGRGDTILINRGWVPLKKKNSERRKNDIVEGVVEVTGIVRLNENRPQFVPKNSPLEGAWYYRDLNAMAQYADTEPVYLDLTTQLGTEDGPIPGQTRVTMRNEHVSYIFTWFTLSIITGWMWHRMFIRRLPLL